MTYLGILFTAVHRPALTLALTPFLILVGCQKAPDAPPQKAAQATPAPRPEPEANVFVNEPTLAKPYAVIGGAVQNVGKARLEKLSVEIELRRRADAGVERVAFKSLPGAKRPPEKIKDNVIIVKTPAKKKSGDDFINTPDTPYSVP